MTEGTLYGVGVGPGDPELMTLKAVRILNSVPVIAWPAPDKGTSFARSIASQHIPDKTIEIPILVPMIPGEFPYAIYAQAAGQIMGHLAEGRDVAVLCEGDPFFYGSFMYIHEMVRHNFSTQIIPGVSSLMACAARAGKPLARRDDMLQIIPATLDEDTIENQLAECDSIAFIKIGRHYSKIRTLLEKLGRLDQATYIERATLDNEKIMPLRKVRAEHIPYFSMILVN